MSYPSGPPGNSGYQPAPQAPQYGAPSQQYGAPQDASPPGPSKLPLYLDAGVAALGLAAYLSTFGIDNVAVAALVPAVLAALLAGVGLLPKQTKRVAIVAAIATLGFFVVLAGVIGAGVEASDWPLYLLLVFTALQALTAVGALLLDAEVITAPEPKPHYDQGFGQYGAPGGYYPQQYGGPPQQGPAQQAPSQHRPAYTQVTQYGGGYNAPTTGGFPSQGGAPASAQTAQSGPPTPPTGFPAYGQPGSAQGQPSETTALTQSFDTQQPQHHAAPPSAPPPS